MQMMFDKIFVSTNYRYIYNCVGFHLMTIDLYTILIVQLNRANHRLIRGDNKDVNNTICCNNHSSCLVDIDVQLQIIFQVLYDLLIGQTDFIYRCILMTLINFFFYINEFELIGQTLSST